jgi:hypothetical protein
MKSFINDEDQRGITSSKLSGLLNSTGQSSSSTLTAKCLELVGQSLLHNEI